MNREILFRGKRIDNGEWVQGDLVHTESGFAFIKDPTNCEYGLWENGHYCGNHFVDKVDPSTVGQYTDMTDKNGVRIFEGDIVYISDWESMAEVYWRGGAWLLKFGDNDEYLYDISKDCEAIGNIHDGKDGRHDEL